MVVAVMLWPSQVVSPACQQGNGMAVSDPLPECAALRLDFLGASQLIKHFCFGGWGRSFSDAWAWFHIKILFLHSLGILSSCAGLLRFPYSIEAQWLSWSRNISVNAGFRNCRCKSSLRIVARLGHVTSRSPASSFRVAWRGCYRAFRMKQSYNSVHCHIAINYITVFPLNTWL
jgi:hypothetical protein